jgi:hypothetical protein
LFAEESHFNKRLEVSRQAEARAHAQPKVMHVRPGERLAGRSEKHRSAEDGDSAIGEPKSEESLADDCGQAHVERGELRLQLASGLRTLAATGVVHRSGRMSSWSDPYAQPLAFRGEETLEGFDVPT